jgi:hypothetical protein
VCLALASSSCASVDLSRVPDGERAAFERCTRHPACSRVMCGEPDQGDPLATLPGVFGRRACFASHAEEYSALPTARHRRAYLLDRGCPESMLRDLE